VPSELKSTPKPSNSGILHFESDPEYFTITLSVYSYKCWVDVSTNFGARAILLRTSILNTTSLEVRGRASSSSFSAASMLSIQGTDIKVIHTPADDRTPVCTIVICHTVDVN